MTLLILVRHAAATGQDPSRPLTEVGSEQAQKVASFIKEFYWVDHIFSSPFVRALKTAEPLAKQFSLDVKIDDRLRERVLYRDVAPVDWKVNWQNHLMTLSIVATVGKPTGREGRGPFPS